MVNIIVNTEVFSWGAQGLPTNVGDYQNFLISLMDFLSNRTLSVEFQPGLEFNTLYNDTKCSRPVGNARQQD